MTVCQVCQKENPAGAEYCEDCGAALSVATPTPVGAGVSGGGSAAASATGTGPTASAAGSVGSLAPEGPTTVSDSSAPPASDVPAVPTVPPTSSSTSAAASPAAPSETGASGQPAPSAVPSTGQDAGSASPGTPSTAEPQAQARLVSIRYGAPTGDEIPLHGQRLVVGRFDPETGPVDVDLSEAAESGHISRQHGELYREADGSWMVRDLGSTNGVFVKSGDTASFGPRITAPRPLKDGDEVAFGNARFIFKTT